MNLRASILFALSLSTAFTGHSADTGTNVFIEAEQFSQLGGWVVDQQFMDQMGSPYILAHGLGEPVKDAEITVTFPNPGEYHLWVRTRDWVAPWKAPGAPGKFQVMLNGKAVATTFGTEGADWHWQDGGIVTAAKDTKVALHDLTGFEGRCDALVFCSDVHFQPPNGLKELASFRRASLGQPEQPEDGGEFDLVVVGGGIAGTSAAISAARFGLKVALVQDRPVLGGNGSSEVRVWPEGNINQKPYAHIGDIVAELVPAKKHPSPEKDSTVYGDDRKLAIVRSEPNITLLTDHHVNEVEAHGGKIQSVVAQDTHTGRRVRLRAKLFADCTGDGDVGFLAGANNEVSSEDHLGASNLWSVHDTASAKDALLCECKDTNALNNLFAVMKYEVPFPRCPWAIDLTDKPFPGRVMKDAKAKNPKAKAVDPLSRLGGWFWESGFNRDPIADVEWMRDQNFRAMYGAWDALKNVDKLYPNYHLGWAAYIAGKRESRRLLGDVILTDNDFRANKVWEDGVFPCSWSIDLHSPATAYQKGVKGQEFIASSTVSAAKFKYQGPYWAPYRSLYSRNVTNLFMAGRDISVTHEGLGPVRVMRTCGMMGEVVGMAASLCKEYQTSPRGVYQQHLVDLKKLMERGAGKTDLAQAAP